MGRFAIAECIVMDNKLPGITPTWVTISVKHGIAFIRDNYYIIRILDLLNPDKRFLYVDTTELMEMNDNVCRKLKNFISMLRKGIFRNEHIDLIIRDQHL